MKAMILAAGLGTRLRPLTNDRPKALVEVAGRTMLELTLARLRGYGVNEVIVNTHHYADLMEQYLAERGNFGMKLEISREDVLLDTGGGLKKAASFFLRDDPDEPFLLHNVDVLSTIDLTRMVRFHIEHNALATLAVQERDTSRPLLFDVQGQLCGRRLGNEGKAEWARRPDLPKHEPEDSHAAALCQGTTSVVPNKDVSEGALAPEGRHPSSTQSPLHQGFEIQELAFSGVHVLSPRIFSKLTEEGPFSIVPAYLRLAGEDENILAFRADEYYWRDLGRIEHLQRAALDMAAGTYPVH